MALGLPDLSLNPGQILFGGLELTENGNHVPSVFIKELTGQQRFVELQGRALPLRGVSWGGIKQRTKLTWYQGNPTGTQQVLGPEEQPSSLSGLWSDRYIQGTVLINNSPDAVTTAEQCVRLFYDLARSGNSLNVVWGTESRVGILKEFDAQWQTLQDVSWRMEFEWSSRDTELPTNRVGDQAAPNLVGEMNALDDLLAFGPLDVVTRFEEAIINRIDRVRGFVGQAFDYLRAINALAAAPATLYGALNGAVGSIRLELEEEIRHLMETPLWGYDAGDETGSPAAVARVASLLSVDGYRRDAAAAMASLQGAAMALGVQQSARAQPTPLIEVTIPQDTSMYALSSRYYNTPDLAGYLARSNGLQSMIAPAGFRLRVPPRPAAGAEQESC